MHQHPAGARAHGGGLQVGQVVARAEAVPAELGRRRQAVGAQGRGAIEERCRDAVQGLDFGGRGLELFEEKAVEGGEVREVGQGRRSHRLSISMTTISTVMPR